MVEFEIEIIKKTETGPKPHLPYFPALPKTKSHPIGPSAPLYFSLSHLRVGQFSPIRPTQAHAFPGALARSVPLCRGTTASTGGPMDQLHPFPSATDFPDDMWGLRARVFLLLGLPSSPNKPRTLLNPAKIGFAAIP
jgi:hypothetical protein